MNRIVSVLTLALLLVPTASFGQTPPGDRYLCYKAVLAKKQPKFSAVQKTLEDQFGAFLANVKGFKSLCNPVLAAERPTVHQVGYKTILAKTTPPQPKFVKSDHTAFDQFGSHPLTVVKPLELRAPSAKVLGAGGTPTVDTAGVDHFECYQAVPQKGAPKLTATSIAVTDQFGTVDLTLTKITKLCAPVNKDGEDPTAPQHPGHLVCYQAKLPKGVKFPATTVSVNNTNFGPAVLVAKSVAELCVPAFKDAVPTSTPAPTATPGATPTAAVTATPAPGPECETSLDCGGFPESCVDGRCVAPCGPTLCGTTGEVCCSSGPSDGICCDRASERCSATQTSCETVSCPSGQVYVPNINDCCPTADVCGTDFPDDRVPFECCNPAFERCQSIPGPFEGICVLRSLPTPTPGPCGLSTCGVDHFCCNESICCNFYTSTCGPQGCEPKPLP
jgi:hypothetical protein